MKISKMFALLGFVAVLATGCYTERISNQNLSYLYDRDASFVHPEFNVIHKNDSVTQLHFRVNSNELLYLHNQTSAFYSAVFRIRYEVYTQLESKLLIDSSVVDKDSLPEHVQVVITDHGGHLGFVSNPFSKTGFRWLDYILFKWVDLFNPKKS